VSTKKKRVFGLTRWAMSTMTELVFWNEMAKRTSSPKRSAAQAIASSAASGSTSARSASGSASSPFRTGSFGAVPFPLPFAAGSGSSTM
jgi:hypothetical protein